MSGLDAVIIGSGPNGLSAAVALAERGAKVLVLEGRDQPGGGMRTAESTLPGFHHDVCSAVHPMGILSPYWRTLPLEQHGLRWLSSQISIAHPLDDGPAVLLTRSLEETAAQLGRDAGAYRRLLAPFLRDPHGLLDDALAPLGFPKHVLTMLRFGLLGMRTAKGLAKRFEGKAARALLAGCAAHTILPFDRSFTAAITLMFLISGHVEAWPVAAGGSRSITSALVSLLGSLGGALETGRMIGSLAELPPARVYLFDTSPASLAALAEPLLPARYVRRLRRYVYGPGVFKLDWALAGSIPWKDARCRTASTVHLGGSFEEIADGEARVWRGEHPERPSVLLCQQSELDDSRAPKGQHTGYAYCHVPPSSTVDVTAQIEAQVERFAPGFRDLILARKATSCADFQAYNPNFVGGAVTGGAADITQLFTRPVARWNPYTTPHPRIFICSASTPPGGGVHGMCGFHAARAAFRQMGREKIAPLA